MVPTTASAAADTTAPTALSANPTAAQTVSGTVPVAADVWDDVGVRSAQFLLDGKLLGQPVTASVRTPVEYQGCHTWVTLAVGTCHRYGRQRRRRRDADRDGPEPPPPMTCFVLQAHRTVRGRGLVTATGLDTAMPGEYLYAFVSSDGPSGAGSQATTLSGAHAVWRLFRRANRQTGVSEVWQARAASVLSNATVRSAALVRGYQQTLTVIAMEGTDGIGAAVSASGVGSRPLALLRTARSTSLVFAVGDETIGPLGDDPPAGWVRLAGFAGPSPAFWSQYTNQPTGDAGHLVPVERQTATAGSWNVVAVEIPGDD
jgi:Big-like domain-containing protein